MSVLIDSRRASQTSNSMHASIIKFKAMMLLNHACAYFIQGDVSDNVNGGGATSGSPGGGHQGSTGTAAGGGSTHAQDRRLEGGAQRTHQGCRLILLYLKRSRMAAWVAIMLL